MLASKLIKELQDLVEVYGDRPVYWPGEQGTCCQPDEDPNEIEGVYPTSVETRHLELSKHRHVFQVGY